MKNIASAAYFVGLLVLAGAGCTSTTEEGEVGQQKTITENQCVETLTANRLGLQYEPFEPGTGYKARVLLVPTVSTVTSLQTFQVVRVEGRTGYRHLGTVERNAGENTFALSAQNIQPGDDGLATIVYVAYESENRYGLGAAVVSLRSDSDGQYFGEQPGAEGLPGDYRARAFTTTSDDAVDARSAAALALCEAQS